MIEITGKYTKAKILINNVESGVIKQVQFLCNHPLFENKQIVIQPDTHVGKATVIGLCAEIDTRHIIPQLLGTDIGCTITAFEIKGKENDYSKLDKIIKDLKVPRNNIVDRLIEDICKRNGLNAHTYYSNWGTIGSGNHFISVEQGQKKYLIIHSGSRTLGKDVAIKYSQLALEQNPYKGGEEKQLSWLNEDSSIEYQKDFVDLQYWVYLNQQEIAHTICKQMKWKIQDQIKCPHNFIDLEHKVLHKGSIKLFPGYLGIVPINMADGTFIIRGSHNIKYEQNLYSAPHGAGRVLKRADAKEQLDMKEFKQRMKNIYCSNVSIGNIDESPMAYKPIEEIKNAIEPYCEIVGHLIPVYNYKN